MGSYRNRIAGNHHEMAFFGRAEHHGAEVQAHDAQGNICRTFLPASVHATALSASQCDPASIAVASHFRLARASQNSIDHGTKNANCRAYFKEFVEALTARQTVATCQDGLGPHRALELIDAEIQQLHDRIAEQSCEP
jgi:hypothetical protein